MSAWYTRFMNDKQKPPSFGDTDGNLEPPPKKNASDPAPATQKDGNLEPPPKVIETPATG